MIYEVWRIITFYKVNDIITKKGALDSQPQVIKFTSCLPMVSGSLQVLRLLPPLKLVAHDIAEILLKAAL
jgi:phosphohistidine swiveling domain-containing protein